MSRMAYQDTLIEEGLKRRGEIRSSEKYGDECLEWRAMVDKARRDIEAHRAMVEVRDMAEAISLEQIQSDLEVIKRWANSLKMTL